MIETGLMLWVAVAGLVSNLIAMRLLHAGHERSLNLRAAYLEVVTDVLGSLGVIGAALLMRPTGWQWLDPAISAVIGIVIVPRTIFLLRQSGHILLEGSPRDVDLSSLRQKLRDTPGVAGVHDVHLWTLTSGMNSASAHIRAAPGWRSDDVLSAAQKLFEEQAGISHATIQVEATPEAECPDTAKHP